MKPDPELNQDDERVSLRLKVSELERNFMEERHKFERLQAESDEIGKLLAFKETEKYRREMLRLNEHVRRLEEDLKTLREREMIDRQTINKLLQEIEMNEKSVEFKVTNKDLECAMRRAQEEAREWTSKFSSLKARESVLVDEISTLKEKPNHSFERRTDINVINIDDDDEELPNRTAQESLKRKCPGESPLSVPEPKGQSTLKKRKAEVQSGDVGVKEPSTAADIQRPIAPVNATQAQVTHTGFPPLRERYTPNLSTTSYAGMPSPCGQRQSSVLPRERLQSNLKLGHPSFIKIMVPSSVSGRFLLNLPLKFCLENQLPSCRMKMVLEDEDGQDYEVFYVGYRNGFYADGWKHFASTHCLEVGDALIFKLSGPARFKVNIIKANMELTDDNANDDNAGTTSRIDPSVPGVLTRRAARAKQTGKAPA